MAKKNKIGVLTLPLSNYNYGGILQAYALQTFLISLGFRVVYLDRQYDIAPAVKFKMMLHSLIHYKEHKKAMDKVRNFYRFIDANLKTSKAIYSSKALAQYAEVEQLDYFITGSDQVWRREYANVIYKDLYLNFTDKPKISYAASFGKDKLSEVEDTYELKSFLRNFKAISVREKSGIQICENLGIKNAEHHVDPTLLLKKEDYLKLLEEQNISTHKNDKFLLSYILDDSEEKNSIIQTVANEKQLAVRKNGKNAIDSINTPQRYISIETWIERFSKADFVVTDSFHGCVFSILFNIPFVAIGNRKRGLSRFNSMLEMFDLKDRLVVDDSFKSIQNIAKTPISFTTANARIEVEREKSKNYLMDHLT